MLQYLFSPTKQFTYDSGKLLDAGQIYVYIQDTTDLATLYDDNGDYVSNPIILDVNGRASVKADDTYEYRLEVYDCFGVLQFTCTAFYGGEGGGGTFIVRHDDTLSGNGTSQSLLGVVNIPLAVDETMTAYEDEVSGENALILGVNGDWFGETFSAYYNNKVDLSSFNELSGIVNDKADTTALNNYYTKDETNNLFQPQSAMGDYYLKTQTSSDVQLAEAFANIPGGSGSDIWISGVKIIAPDTIDLFPGTTAQSLSSFTVSGNKNHCIAVKGGIYRVPDINQWVSAISSTNYFTTQNEFYSSANMMSAAINYVSANAGGTFTGVSANIPFTGNGTNESPLGLMPYISYGGNGITSTYSKSGLRVLDSDNNSAYYSASGINLNNESITDTDIAKWNSYSGAINNLENGKQDNLTFGYDEFNNISSINNSAVWGSGGGTFPVNAYTLTGNAGIDVSTDHVNNQTIVSYTGIMGDSAVNNVVRNYSAAGKWLTAHQSLSNYYTKTDTSSKQQISAALNYISSNIFPITSVDGTTTYEFDANSSSLYFTTAQNQYGATTTFNINGVKYAAYPNTNISATWIDLIKGPNISAFAFGNSPMTEYIQISALTYLKEIDFIAPYDGGTGTNKWYSAIFMDGDNTVGHIEVASGTSRRVVYDIGYNGGSWMQELWDPDNQTFYHHPLY